MVSSPEKEDVYDWVKADFFSRTFHMSLIETFDILSSMYPLIRPWEEMVVFVEE